MLAHYHRWGNRGTEGLNNLLFTLRESGARALASGLVMPVSDRREAIFPGLFIKTTMGTGFLNYSYFTLEIHIHHASIMKEVPICLIETILAPNDPVKSVLQRDEPRCCRGPRASQTRGLWQGRYSQAQPPAGGARAGHFTGCCLAFPLPPLTLTALVTLSNRGVRCGFPR